MPLRAGAQQQLSSPFNAMQTLNATFHILSGSIAGYCFHTTRQRESNKRVDQSNVHTPVQGEGDEHFVGILKATKHGNSKQQTINIIL